MSLYLDEFRWKLISKMLFAGSQQEVKLFCDAAMLGLDHHKISGHIISRFVDKIIDELGQFNPMIMRHNNGVVSKWQKFNLIVLGNR